MYDKIGIIGDVHSEHEHLEQAIEHLARAGAQILLCTGDLADGPGKLDRCVQLLQANEVTTVRGNHDRWVVENKARHIPHAHHAEDLDPKTVEFLHNLPTQKSIDTTAGTLLLCHGVGDNDMQKVWPGTQRMPIERSMDMDNMIATGQFQLMVNGHVHYRTVIHFDSLTLLNAGTLMRRHHPGFSMLDLTNKEVLGFEFDPMPHLVKRQSLTPDANTQTFVNTAHFSGNWQALTLYA